MTKKWWKPLLGAGILALFVAVREWQLQKQFAARRTLARQSHPEMRPPEPGDILLFYRPALWRDIVIQIGTGSPVYHCAFFAAQDERGMVVLEARPKGVIWSDLQGRENKYIVVPAPEGKGQTALDWAQTKLGSPYDYGDGLVIGLEHLFTHWRINYTPPGRYTCGELLAAAFAETGVDLVPGKRPAEVAPGDLANALAKRSGV